MDGEWKNEFSKERTTEHKNIFLIISVLKEQTFSDIWELNVLFWLELFSSSATTALGWRKEGSLFFLVLVYLHFWLQPKRNTKGRLEEIYITNNARLPVFSLLVWDIYENYMLFSSKTLKIDPRPLI